MKNVINAGKVFVPTTAIAAAREDMQAAQDKLREAKRSMASNVSAYLHENPDAILTCGDMGRAFGIRACEAGRIMEDFGKGVTATGVSVVRKFAEINENGEVVQGGQIKTVKGSYTGYTARKGW